MDPLERLRHEIHMESAAISPQTTALIEAAREACNEIERLRAENELLRSSTRLAALARRITELTKDVAASPDDKIKGDVAIRE